MGLLSKALRGFHASPHKFDKVNIKPNLGKGEGNQVFGNGLYIAEAEPTMESYYTMFKNRNPILQLNGKDVVGGFFTDEIDRTWPEIIDKIPLDQRYAFHSLIGALDIDGLRGLENASQDELKVFYNYVKPGLRIPPPPQAHRYEMELATDDSRLLNWDKILGDQPDEIFDAVEPQLKKQREIMAAARKRALDKGVDWRGRPLTEYRKEELSSPLKPMDEYTGEETYKLMGMTDDAGRPAKDQEEGYQRAADRLHAVGIDGTKYLDQFSRPSMGNSDPRPNATHNYAIWNDDIINILRRYGIPISSTAAAGGLLSRLNTGSDA